MRAVDDHTTEPTRPLPLPGTPLWLLALVGTLVWVYWPTLTSLVRRWASDPQYTHGYVVPLFAALVLWLRRDRFPTSGVRPGMLGIAIIGVAALARIAGSMYSFEWLEAGSLLPALIGVVWLICGPAVVLWAWPAGALMLFILPWPWQFDQLLTYPLRRLATVCSTYALQTLGVPALARGNIIVINDQEIGVVEACSGLGMLMTFFALSTSVAFAIDRTRFEKFVLFLSAVPIGVLMNVLRITVTVFLFQYASAEIAKIVFHDVAGWVMMPLALIVLWLELKCLTWMWLEREKSRPLPVRLQTPVDKRAASRMADTRPVNELRAHSEGKSETTLEEIPDAAQ